MKAQKPTPRHGVDVCARSLPRGRAGHPRQPKILQDELDGYREYAQRVRYRLLPGIW